MNKTHKMTKKGAFKRKENNFQKFRQGELTLRILVFHVTWHGKGSMRYGCLIPGRVQACQTELTQGREWVRVMASQRRGQPRSKPEWVMGFLEMDGQLFYSRKDHHPLCSQAYAKQEFVFQ